MSFTTAAMTGVSTRANLLEVHLCSTTTTTAEDDSMRRRKNGTDQS
jgi:hypothetical protein